MENDNRVKEMGITNWEAKIILTHKITNGLLRTPIRRTKQKMRDPTQRFALSPYWIYLEERCLKFSQFIDLYYPTANWQKEKEDIKEAYEDYKNEVWDNLSSQEKNLLKLKIKYQNYMEKGFKIRKRNEMG